MPGYFAWFPLLTASQVTRSCSCGAVLDADAGGLSAQRVRRYFESVAPVELHAAADSRAPATRS